MISIDGSQGEGGGQVLRSSLTLAMYLQKPFQIRNIRTTRKKPGLLRQHLTCVQAAARICNGRVQGASLGSTELTFEPGPLNAGNYEFDIGSAGSVMLVLQTVLFPLLFAHGSSTVRLRGGTHNPLAPSFDFIVDAFLPQLHRMGAEVRCRLLRWGFFPRGGGEIVLLVEPVQALAPLRLIERGELISREVRVTVSDLPGDIAEREVSQLKKKLRWPDSCFQIEALKGCGPGNIISVHVRSRHLSEVFTGYGRKGIPAETVADDVAREVNRYLSGRHPVDEHLADQLLLPLYFAGEGVMDTCEPSPHTLTNISIIQQFTGTVFDISDRGNGIHRISLRPVAS